MTENPNRLLDRFGRRITTLRISLTDRCNFRCVYCLPPDGISVLPKGRILNAGEIVRLVRVFGRLGIRRFRLTGGEPLLRKDILEIVSSMRGVEAVRELSITTNGSYLKHLAEPLKSAGLDRLNISLDSLDPERFGAITRSIRYREVREGIEAALRAGFPVKLNVVVMRGISSREIVELVEMAVEGRLEVRFLEFMPLCGSGWRPDLVFPIGEVRDIVGSIFELVERPRGDHPARTYSVAGGRGTVGFIAPLTEPFCERCSRIRISADGKVRPCLFSEEETDLGRLIKENANDDALVGAIRRAVWRKPAGSRFSRAPFRHEAGGGWEWERGPHIRSIGG